MKRQYRTALLLLVLMASGCKKDFLEERQNKGLLVPTTLADFEALLDNTSLVMNLDPALGLASADDYYAVSSALVPLSETVRNVYSWKEGPDLYQGSTPIDWIRPYQQVFYCNVVLEGLEKFPEEQKATGGYRRILGMALFYRSWAFYQLAQIFAPVYGETSAKKELGLILRLSADINTFPQRTTLSESYNRIVSDVQEAEILLPLSQTVTTKPTRLACRAFLARVYLSMSDYTNALKYADLCLSENAKLLDYSLLSTTATRPMPRSVPSGNDEVIYHSGLVDNYGFPGNGFSNTLIRIDSSLYRSYHPNDLRKTLFFNALPGDQGYFKGSYTGAASIPLIFSGLANDEILLIRAECRARTGNAEGAMGDLNTLLLTRWKKGTFVPLAAPGPTEALQAVLRERRKELVSRGMRWTDLRRLNLDPTTATTLYRNINGNVYTLGPNDPRYILPFPDSETGEGIPQNPR